MKSLGDLSTNYGMGVRVRHEIDEILLINGLPKEVKAGMINAKTNDLIKMCEGI